MEKSLDHHLEEILSEHGVVGAMCCDQQGLVLAAKGTLSEGHAGSISVLTSEAKKLFPDVDAEPVICLESDACNCLIKSHGKVTIAIQKVPS